MPRRPDALRLAAALVASWLSLGSARAADAYDHVARSPDGTGIVYLGRETARIMGHEGSDWLERPDRLVEERPDLLLRTLDLAPGMQVADIGAGTGFYSWRIAQRVAPSGRVYAVDVQPEMLTLLAAGMKAHHVVNVTPVLGGAVDPGLPRAALDLALMVDVYHEFDHPREMLAAIVDALRPGGRVVFVEYRQEDPAVAILPHHKMGEAQVRREAAAAGLVWQKTIETLPTQHVVIFTKPAR